MRDMGGDREHPAHDVGVGGDFGRFERLVLQGRRRRQVAPPCIELSACVPRISGTNCS